MAPTTLPERHAPGTKIKQQFGHVQVPLRVHTKRWLSEIPNPSSLCISHHHVF